MRNNREQYVERSRRHYWANNTWKCIVRWFLSRPIAAQYAMKMNTSPADTTQNEPGLYWYGKASNKRWDDDVQRMTKMFDNVFLDPFDTIQIHFASGVINVTSVIQNSLTSALDRRYGMLKKFIRERTSLYDPLTRSNVKTMSLMKQTVRLKTKDLSMDVEVIYIRLLAMNTHKRVPLKRVMAFENSPVPHEEGVIQSCTKADFMHKLGLTSRSKCDKH